MVSLQDGRQSWRDRASALSLVVLLFTLHPPRALAQLAEPIDPLRNPRDSGQATAIGSGSDTVQGLVQEALTRSPLVLAARAHWQAQARMPIQVDTLPDPQIGLQHFTVGNPQPFSGYETSNFYYTGFGLSQDIPGPGKLHLRAKQAEKDAEYARQAFEVQQRQVVEQVRETYFNLFYLTRTLDLLRQTRDQLERIENTTRSQYQVGMAQQQDVLKAQLEMTAILKEIETNGEELGQAQAALKAILGREQDEREILIGDVTPSQLRSDDAQLKQRALASSPVLKQAQASEARSDVSLKLARRDYVPDFNVGYTYQKTGPGFRDYYMLTLGAKIPMYFWRKQTPAVEQAALEKESAHSQTYASKLSVLSELQNQWLAVKTTSKVLTLYRDGLIPQAQATEQSAMAGYRVGKVDFQTFLSAVVEVLRLRQEYYRTLADHEVAIGKIQQIAGDVP